MGVVWEVGEGLRSVLQGLWANACPQLGDPNQELPCLHQGVDPLSLSEAPRVIIPHNLPGEETGQWETLDIGSAGPGAGACEEGPL